MKSCSLCLHGFDIIFVLIANVEVQIVVPLKAKVADDTDERLFVDMSLQMAFHVWLCGESFSANVAVKRLRLLVKSFVESPETFDFEVFFAVSAFEWSHG